MRNISDLQHIAEGIPRITVRGAGPIAAHGHVEDEVQRGGGETIPDALAEVTGDDAVELGAVAVPGQRLGGPVRGRPVPLDSPRVPPVIRDSDGGAPPTRLVAHAPRVHVAVDRAVPC